MPELPEVETIRRQLTPDIIGKIIKEIEILETKQFIGKKEDVVGRKIINIDRVGKVIFLKLSNNKYLNCHLKLTGQILFTDNAKNPVFPHPIPFTGTNKMPANTTRIIIRFTDGSGLFFNDLRKFGWLKVTNTPEKPKGIDILSKDFTFQLVNSLTRQTEKPIKLLLMDQEKIAGIGNIYANDSLWEARINPSRKSKSLSDDEIKNLYLGIKKIIQEGLHDKGSSAADESYVLPSSKRGQYQERFKVYQREGKPCLRDKTSIKRVKQSGRSSFFCPKCQK